MTHILVTNDDGVLAPGLAALAAALRAIGDVSVLAPDRNWSASGHVKTMHKPLRVREAKLADGETALATNGAPSDCVAMAALGLFDRPIDLVMSGINPNANLGHDITYSGTVTAAMEAAISKIPGVAVSLAFSPAQDFATAGDVARRVARLVLDKGLPPRTLLNVNVPAGRLEDIRGYRVTTQGLRVYRDELVRREDPRGEPYYWIGGEPPEGNFEPDSDFQALVDGFVSVTPLQLDLTARSFLEGLAGWRW